MAEEVRIAKKDIYADVEGEGGHKVLRLVAREGAEVPRGFADLVKDSEVSSEVPKTRSVLAGRSTSARQAREGQPDEPDHADARETAAGVTGSRKGRRSGANKSRKSAGDKARKSDESESKGSDK